MAYQPPPGTSSLPPRPPVSSSNGNSDTNGRAGFKPPFPSASSKPPGHAYASAPAPAYNSSAPRYAPGTSPAQYGQSAYPGFARGGGGGGRGAGGPYGHHHQAAAAPQQRPSYGPQNTYGHAPASCSSAPQIRNPFPSPAQAVAASAHPPGSSIAVSNPNDYDPDMAAQIAHWQSAYSREPTVAAAAPALDRYGKPVAAAPYTETPRPDFSPATGAPPAHGDKHKTVVRHGGGKKWTDDTLLEWDPAHLRLFVGNLAGETTDDSILKAFSPWKSVQRAKVVRDKRTNKSKGYGFVSFSDADDFFNAAKAMNGQYIQSHPVIVKKANTEIKAVNVKEKKGGGGGGGGGGRNNKHKKSGNRQQNGAGSGHADSGTGYEPSLGPVPHGGVVKPGQKTKNGLRLLG